MMFFVWSGAKCPGLSAIFKLLKLENPGFGDIISNSICFVCKSFLNNRITQDDISVL